VPAYALAMPSIALLSAARRITAGKSNTPYINIAARGFAAVIFNGERGHRCSREIATRGISAYC